MYACLGGCVSHCNLRFLSLSLFVYGWMKMGLLKIKEKMEIFMVTHMNES